MDEKDKLKDDNQFTRLTEMPNISDKTLVTIL